MLNHALRYLSLGFSVIPLKSRTKDQPLIAWKEYQKRLPTEAEVKSWWTKWPDANIAGVTGELTNKAVVDLELAGLATVTCVSPLTVLTGRGKHLWFQYPKGLRNGVALKGITGFDIRGEGGYALLPPSIHPSGKRYSWSRFVPNSITTFPMELLSVSEDVANGPGTGLTPVSTPKEKDWIATALQGMTNGNIDDTLFLLCSRLRGDGYSATDAKLLLQPHADRAGATPGHLDDKIENVWGRYEPRAKAGSTYVHGSNEQSDSLVIHSPANNNSWQRFNTRHSVDSENDKRAYLFSGYPKLDEMLKGGLKSSRLFTLAARTGTGKTNWVISVSRTLCMEGKKVLLFSTEMPYEEIWQRYIATLPDPNGFTNHKFFVCDSFTPSLERVEEALKEVKPDLFVFDHINHISEEQKVLGTFMQGLNFLRRKYDCAGIVTAQLNRAADWVDPKKGERVTPRMSMIKGSGTIEQASSRVLLLSETRVSPDMTEIIGNLDKNDNGPKGLLHFGLKTNPYRMVEL